MKHLILCLMAAASPVFADGTRCQDQFDAFMDLAFQRGLIQSRTPGLLKDRFRRYCGIKGVPVTLFDGSRVSVPILRWYPADWQTVTEESPPSTRLEFRAIDIRLQPPNPASGLSLGHVFDGVLHRIVLISDWDGEAQSVSIDGATADLDSGDGLALAATLAWQDRIFLSADSSVRGGWVIAEASLSLKIGDRYATNLQNERAVIASGLDRSLARMADSFLDEASRDALRMMASADARGELRIELSPGSEDDQLRLLPLFERDAQIDLFYLRNGARMSVTFEPS